MAEFSRLLDKDHKPTVAEIHAAIGEPNSWVELRAYIEVHYDLAPELVFYGKKYGWTIRYRKSGKTLISLFPEHGAFTALIVLGEKETEKVGTMIDEFSPATREIIGNNDQLHDGKWLWIRVMEGSHLEDVRRLLAVKRKPRSKSK